MKGEGYEQQSGVSGGSVAAVGAAVNCEAVTETEKKFQSILGPCGKVCEKLGQTDSRHFVVLGGANRLA